MSFRDVVLMCGAVGALALTLAVPATAAEPVYLPPPQLADVRQAGQDGAGLAPAAVQIDPRAREAWLWECRRRTAQVYDGGWHRHSHHYRHDRTIDPGPAYDYCEAYFDDYYRVYAQPGFAYGYAYPPRYFVQPMATMPAQIPQISEPQEEFIEEYVPIRARSIPGAPGLANCRTSGSN